MRESLYDYERRFGYSIGALERSEIADKNKKLILAFVNDCLSTGLSKSRLSKYIYHLIKMARWLGKDFDLAENEDIKSIVRTIEQSDYAEYSKSELKMILKRLFKWIRQSEDYPPEVKWIRPRGKKLSKIKIPEELLTEEEVKALVRASQKERDRALIATLYESGCRIGELLGLKIKHISFDEYGAQVVVYGMKGDRRIRLISSVPYLHEWLNKHPCPVNPDSLVWVKSDGKALGYGRVTSVISTLGRRAGIKKKLHPHLFRHSRATYLANHLTEAQMKEVFGWVQDSDMASVYVHLSGRDVDDALLKVYGIKKPETRKESTLKSKCCERCQAQNPFSNTFCSKCGYTLEESTRLEIMKEEADRKRADNILDELLKDRQFKELFIEKLMSLKAVKG